MLTKTNHRDLLMDQLRSLSFAEVKHRKAKAMDTISYHAESRRKQLANGMNVTLEQFHKNIARHQLIVECCDAVLSGQ